MDLAVADDLDDLSLDRLADALELPGAPFQREPGDRRRRLPDLRRCPAVGGDPEAVLALELHQIAEQIELRGKLGIPRQRFAHATDDISATLSVVCARRSASQPTTSARTSSRCCGPSWRSSATATACS